MEYGGDKEGEGVCKETERRCVLSPQEAITEDSDEGYKFKNIDALRTI